MKFRRILTGVGLGLVAVVMLGLAFVGAQHLLHEDRMRDQQRYALLASTNAAPQDGPIASNRVATSVTDVTAVDLALPGGGSASVGFADLPSDAVEATSSLPPVEPFPEHLFVDSELEPSKRLAPTTVTEPDAFAVAQDAPASQPPATPSDNELPSLSNAEPALPQPGTAGPGPGALPAAGGGLQINIPASGPTPVYKPENLMIEVTRETVRSRNPNRREHEIIVRIEVPLANLPYLMPGDRITLKLHQHLEPGPRPEKIPDQIDMARGWFATSLRLIAIEAVVPDKQAANTTKPGAVEQVSLYLGIPYSLFAGEVTPGLGSLISNAGSPFVPLDDRWKRLGLTAEAIDVETITEQRTFREIPTRSLQLNAIRSQLTAAFPESSWFEIVEDEENQTVMLRGLPHELDLFIGILQLFVDAQDRSRDWSVLQRSDPWFSRVLPSPKAEPVPEEQRPWESALVKVSRRSPRTIVQALTTDKVMQGLILQSGWNNEVLLRGPASKLTAAIAAIQKLDQSAPAVAQVDPPAEEAVASTQESPATLPVPTSATVPDANATGSAAPPPAPSKVDWALRVLSHSRQNEVRNSNEELFHLNLPDQNLPDLEVGDTLELMIDIVPLENQFAPRAKYPLRVQGICRPSFGPANTPGIPRVSLIVELAKSGPNLEVGLLTAAEAVSDLSMSKITRLEVTNHTVLRVYRLQHQTRMIHNFVDFYQTLYSTSSWLSMSVDPGQQTILVSGFPSEHTQIADFLRLIDQPQPLRFRQSTGLSQSALPQVGPLPEPRWDTFLIPVLFRKPTELEQILTKFSLTRPDLRFAVSPYLNAILVRTPSDTAGHQTLIDLIPQLDQPTLADELSQADQAEAEFVKASQNWALVSVPDFPEVPAGEGWATEEYPVRLTPLLPFLQHPLVLGPAIRNQQISIKGTTGDPYLEIAGPVEKLVILRRFLHNVQQAARPWPREDSPHYIKLQSNDAARSVKYLYVGSMIAPPHIGAYGLATIAAPAGNDPFAPAGLSGFAPDLGSVSIAPDPARRQQLLQEFAETDSRARSLAVQYQQAPDEPDFRKSLEQQIKEALYQAFQLRQQAQELELAELQQKVKTASDRLQQRQSRKEEIVSRRIQQLLQTSPADWDPPLFPKTGNKIPESAGDPYSPTPPTNAPVAPAPFAPPGGGLGAPSPFPMEPAATIPGPGTAPGTPPVTKLRTPEANPLDPLAPPSSRQPSIAPDGDVVSAAPGADIRGLIGQTTIVIDGNAVVSVKLNHKDSKHEQYSTGIVLPFGRILFYAGVDPLFEEESFEVTLTGGQKQHPRVLWYNANNGLALCQVALKGFPTLRPLPISAAPQLPTGRVTILSAMADVQRQSLMRELTLKSGETESWQGLVAYFDPELPESARGSAVIDNQGQLIGLALQSSVLSIAHILNSEGGADLPVPPMFAPVVPSLTRNVFDPSAEPSSEYTLQDLQQVRQLVQLRNEILKLQEELDYKSKLSEKQIVPASEIVALRRDLTGKHQEVALLRDWLKVRETQLKQLRETLEQKLQIAMRDRERIASLRKAGAISAEEVDRAEDRYLEAKSKLDQILLGQQAFLKSVEQLRDTDQSATPSSGTTPPTGSGSPPPGGTPMNPPTTPPVNPAPVVPLPKTETPSGEEAKPEAEPKPAAETAVQPQLSQSSPKPQCLSHPFRMDRLHCQAPAGMVLRTVLSRSNGKVMSCRTEDEFWGAELWVWWGC